VLVGMMGSGKTTVGRLLSQRTGWPYHDNDELLARLYRATPREILAGRGESVLRESESRALALGLDAQPPCIIGAAGGTILDQTNRRRLQAAGIVAWLRASAAELEARAMSGAHRPWIDTGGGTWIASAVKSRDPLYASVADITLDTDGRSPRDTVRELLAELAVIDACRPHLPRAED
jgi:shikimate kinase